MSADPQKTVLECLQAGELSVEGQFMWGSNYTFLLDVLHDDTELKGVYKPTRGERPLWDFPEESLAGREVAAFLVSEALGLHLVPPTVYRQEGPAGPGSLQLFVDHDPEYHYFNLTAEDKQRLRPVAFFDILINNTDRKGGHILFDHQDNIWLIDHGITFHVHHKLRTVVWDFSGETLPDELCEKLTPFRQQLTPETALYQQLSKYISRREIHALAMRAEELRSNPRFPYPRDNMRSYPWPPV
ncbi:MAG: SCO1664 family protein [Anaerolineales bacterium]|nr:SCO1664 family protein [Anaerolineales bacterium]